MRRTLGVLVAATSALALSCVAPAGPGIGDVAPPGVHVEAWSVLPPGNGYPTGITARNRDDQRLLYERLDDAVATTGISDGELGRYYKQSSIDLPPSESLHTDRPAVDVTVDWDRWGVPYVRGDDAAAVAYGAGWATMEGRALVAELARVVGRRGAQELGVDDLFAAIDPDRRIDYTDAELESRLHALVARDAEDGAAIIAEIDAYLEGINRWIDQHPEHLQMLQLLGLPAGKWKRADVVAALFTVITGPSSGGEELANSAALQRLADQLGELAPAAYHDLRAADAPTTTHVDSVHEYPTFSGEAPAAGELDVSSIAHPDDPMTAAIATSPETVKQGRSNVIAVSSDRSASGHPLLVGGPQNGLTSPSLLFEMVLDGGGFRSRGVVLPGGGPYVFVGHTDSYAWTSTSGETTRSTPEPNCSASPTVPRHPPRAPTTSSTTNASRCPARTAPRHEQSGEHITVR